MIAERTLALAAHLWGAQAVPFSDQPKAELFRTASIERATALLNQSAALRSVMLPERGERSGQKRSGRTLAAFARTQSLFSGLHYPSSLTGIGLLAVSQKLGNTPRHQRSINLKLLEEAFAELGRAIPVLLLHEAQNYNTSALEEVRMLLGLNLPELPAFALILVGDSPTCSRPCVCVPFFLLAHRRSRLHREFEARGARSLISSTSSARSASSGPALKPRRSICWPAPAKASRAPSICWLARPGSKRQKRRLSKLLPLIFRALSSWFPECSKCVKTLRLDDRVSWRKSGSNRCANSTSSTASGPVRLPAALRSAAALG